VIESDRDPRQGNGATLIIKDGTLKTGSFVVAGSAYAPVRFIESWSGTRIEEAPPSTPVRIVGFSDLPETGSTITVVKNKKEAEETVATLAKETEREQFEGSTTGAVLPLIIKADAAGSVDAIKYELRKVSHPHIALKIIGSGVGQISEGDVKMAIAAGNGLIVGFHTKPEKSAADLADRSDIEIKTFTIIYELTECVDEALKARAPKVQTEEVLGRAKVLRTFSTMGTKQVIGARVIEGVFLLGRSIKIERRGVDLGKGKILNLQVQRVDKENVPVETEFGAQVDSRTEIAVGDELICYHIVTT
jgi:translation initiation factor IF-2